MRILFWVAALWQVSAAMAVEMVVVPNDYNLIELPIGSVVRMKKETILPGSSTKIDVVDTKTSQDGNTVFRTCTLSYLPSPQRRTLPANLDLYISNIAKQESKTATPGYCWKDGQDKTGASITFSLQTTKGFLADLTCYEQTAWIPPQGDACHFNEVPDVGSLSDLQFWADKDALNTTIGLPL